MWNFRAGFIPHLLCCLTVVAIAIPDRARGQEQIKLDLVSPFPGTVVIAKTPTISFRSSQKLSAEGRFVLLDGNDITALVTEQELLYSFTPVNPLGAGEHSVYIVAYGEDGTPVEQEFAFSSRHSETFEEVYSDNRVSATLKTVLNREFSDMAGSSTSVGATDDFPYTSFDSYMTSNSTLREGAWNTSFKTNVRYYDQNASMPSFGSVTSTVSDTGTSDSTAQGQGIGKRYLSLLDFLFTADYTSEQSSGWAEIGDTSIEMSQNTIDYLTRRGGQASFTFGNVTIGGFGVLGAESVYEIDGLGFGFNSNDHIMGTSAQVDFFDRQMSVKGIYVSGGEQGNYFGTWSEGSGRKGDVTGIVWTTDFFEQLFKTEVEFDASNFDTDTGDEADDMYDKAYRIRISGLTETSDYELNYRHTGSQYEVVGNQSAVKDWAGFDFNGGTTLDNHSLRLLLGYSWDNVDDEDSYARIYSFTSGLDYRYMGWERFPVGVSVEHNSQQSTGEPDGIEQTSLDTSTLTGSIGFLDGPWFIELRASLSAQDDQTSNDYDTRLVTVSVVPSYTGTYFSILPSWTLNTSKDLTSGVTIDTNTLTFDVYSSLFEDMVSCEVGGTYDWTTSDDDSIDSNNAALYGRINYRFEGLWRLEDAKIALEYNYLRQEDKIYDTTIYEGILSLVLSTAIPYSF